ncbi:hypothetical protein Ga0466249_005338 [Sporomusaceae bacterium BoRhaA]|nr:hypothetical protein [Pelorhabdus rhamnosifermentans]MBU2704184.1 hypothetical protein [Pelorhabdus rhamnosifermentans]
MNVLESEIVNVRFIDKFKAQTRYEWTVVKTVLSVLIVVCELLALALWE